jgi:hypothetical protein
VARICFASSASFTGCVTSCRNAAAVLGGEWAALTAGDVPGGDLVVLSSWDEEYDGVLAARPGAVVPRWHSPLLQTELSEEGWKLGRLVELLDGGRVPALAVNDPAVAAALGREKVAILPDVLGEGVYAGVVPAELGAGVHVSLLGEAHGRKNLLVQSAAFARVAAQRGGGWTLHLAGQTARRPGYGRWLALANVPHRDHGVLSRPDYLALVAAVDAGLAATLSESFGYVAADHAALGVPVVVSPAVACLEGGALSAEAADAGSVATALARALDEQGHAAFQRAELVARAAQNAAVAKAGLARILGWVER